MSDAPDSSLLPCSGLAIRAADDRKVPALGLIACGLLSAAAVFAAIAVSGATGGGFA